MTSLLVLATMVGCGASTDREGQTGFALTTDILGGTDVIGFNYSVTEVACPSGTQVVDGLRGQTPLTFGLDLLEEFLPGNLPGVTLANVGNSQLEYDSVHLAADLFVDVLPDACYNIVVQPVNAFGADDGTDTDDTPTAQCARAETPAPVYVADGQTTEVFLLSQCVGEPVGALDAAVALNNPPQISSINIVEDKFVHECVGFETCVRAVDPNDDPLLAEFSLVEVTLPDGTVAANGSAEVGTVPVTSTTGTLVGWEERPPRVGALCRPGSFGERVLHLERDRVRHADGVGWHLCHVRVGAGQQRGGRRDRDVALHAGLPVAHGLVARTRLLRRRWRGRHPDPPHRRHGWRGQFPGA